MSEDEDNGGNKYKCITAGVGHISIKDSAASQVIEREIYVS